MTRITLASGKVTLSVAPSRRVLLRKIKALAESEGKSVSEHVWELCEQALQGQPRVKGTPVALPGADLGQVLVTDREELYDDVVAHRF